MDHAIDDDDDDEGHSLKQLGKKLQILEKVRSGEEEEQEGSTEYGRKMENFALVDKCCLVVVASACVATGWLLGWVSRG